MASVNLTDALRWEYDELFNACVIRSNGAAEVEAILGKIDANRSRYAGSMASRGKRPPMHSSG